MALTPAERLAQLLNRAMVEATREPVTVCPDCRLSVRLHQSHDGSFIGCYAAGARRHA